MMKEKNKKMKENMQNMQIPAAPLVFLLELSERTMEDVKKVKQLLDLLRLQNHPDVDVCIIGMGSRPVVLQDFVPLDKAGLPSLEDLAERMLSPEDKVNMYEVMRLAVTRIRRRILAGIEPACSMPAKVWMLASAEILEEPEAEPPEDILWFMANRLGIRQPALFQFMFMKGEDNLNPVWLERPVSLDKRDDEMRFIDEMIWLIEKLEKEGVDLSL